MLGCRDAQAGRTAAASRCGVGRGFQRRRQDPCDGKQRSNRYGTPRKYRARRRKERRFDPQGRVGSRQSEDRFSGQTRARTVRGSVVYCAPKMRPPINGAIDTGVTITARLHPFPPSGLSPCEGRMGGRMKSVGEPPRGSPPRGNPPAGSGRALPLPTLNRRNSRRAFLHKPGAFAAWLRALVEAKREVPRRNLV